MAYKCPKCGSDVSRGYSGSAQATAGLVGALFYAAFGAFECRKCGKIPKNMFPQDVQAKMTLGSFIMAVVAIGIAAGLFALMVNMD